MKTTLFAAVAVLVGSAGAQAALTSSEAARLTSAAQVVRDINQTIPTDLWSRARCVAVIPDVKKAAFVFGGEYGKGVMSCRSGDGWSAPLFLQLAKGSWGFQAGAEQVDLVLLVMNESGVEKLLRDKVSLGADASVAAGPVGRQGHVGTDAQLTAEILSYSRAQGLFAGVDLSGGVLRPDEDANRNAYGSAAAPRTILASRSLAAPTEATPFLTALASQPVAANASTGSRRSSDEPGRAGETTAGAAAVPSQELRSRIAELRATLDHMLDNATPAGATGTTPSGTSGATGTSGTTVSGGEASATGMVTVDRGQLLKLRQQIDELMILVNGRR